MRYQSALEITNLTVAYNDKPVLWNINTSIPCGVLCAIIGPNGAGKTTLVKSILGLIKPLSGSIRIFGKPYNENRHRVAYVPQRTSVDWDFPINVLDVVLMGCYGRLGWIRRPNKNDRSKALEALQKVGLREHAHRHISQLSGGQQQRVFLARALMQEADIYFMDEPFIGIDVITEKTIISLLQDLCRQGKTVIVVHHNLQKLQEYFGWVALLNINLIACGPIEKVLLDKHLDTVYQQKDVHKHHIDGML